MVNLAVASSAGPSGGCGESFRRTLRLVESSPKGPFDRTTDPDSPVAAPAADEVVVVDTVGVNPYETVVVIRTGSHITQLSALSGPDRVADTATPTGDWAVLAFTSPAATTAVQIASTDGATRRFFLADGVGPCHPSPRQPMTPDCSADQHRISIQPDAGAGSVAISARLEAIGVAPCVLREPVTAEFRYANGQADGPPVTARVSWILPQTVEWPAGVDCFTRTETVTVTAGRATAQKTFPGGDCSATPAGADGAKAHPLGTPTVN